MSKGILQADGTRCYRGATCQKHAPNKKITFNEFYSEVVIPVLSQKQSLESEFHSEEYQVIGDRILQKYGTSFTLKNLNSKSVMNGANEIISLSDCSDGSLAENNCEAVTEAIVSRIHANEFNADEIEKIEIVGDAVGVYHAAVAALVDDEWVVFDYTARQFNETLPFPLVAPQDVWKKILEDKIGLGELRYGNDEEEEYSSYDEDEY